MRSITSSTNPFPVSQFVIDVPAKVWRPKPMDRYQMVDYADDIDDGVFVFKRYGKAVVRSDPPFTSTRDDIHYWDTARDQAELDKDFRIADHVSPEVRQQVIDIIQRYWDCFYSEGVQRPILDFEFAIDTGQSQPVCCKKPHYGPHESKIIMTQVQVLLDNNWIRRCYGPWGSSIVLAAKPHQEHVDNINDFVWRMCVSYRRLNQYTLPFEYPIPRCDDAIDNFGDSAGLLFFISLDCKTGYHQISVRLADQEKLAFFAPDDKKYCFVVMPFGPRNAPAFYTCMMGFMRDEWNVLFVTRYPQNRYHRGDRVIIDDILLWSTHLPTILLYFECVCEVFQKYRVTFQLKKCDFLKNRVEYVGHDITPDGNCPAESKFDLIRDWALPSAGAALISFIGLLTFYNVYCPWFEIRVKPLRQLERKYHRKAIPDAEWTPPLVALWDDLKLSMVSSPCLARYDAELPCFLKTDWSADGMGWILMQPDNSAKSAAALLKLRATGECDFDVTMGGARLRPVRFGSRSCTSRERHFHSFVGEAGCGRWSISQNKKYLWGAEFYWICDCSAIQEILEYDGPLHQIRRWAQELLGYHFRIFHRPARMMRDVDGLSRRFDNALIEKHCRLALSLSLADAAARPNAYSRSSFYTDNPLKCPATVSSVAAVHTFSTVDPAPTVFASVPSPFAVGVNLPLRFRPSPLDGPTTPYQGGSHQLLSRRKVPWMSLTPQFGAIAIALSNHSTSFSSSCVIVQPASFPATAVCRALLPNASFVPYSLLLLYRHIRQLFYPSVADARHASTTLNTFLSTHHRLTGFDATCPHRAVHSQQLWLPQVLNLIDLLHRHYHLSSFFIFIALDDDLDCGCVFSDILDGWTSGSWSTRSGPTTAALYGDGVNSRRWCCIGQRHHGIHPNHPPVFPPVHDHFSCFGDHVNTSLNCVDATSIAIPRHVINACDMSNTPAFKPRCISILELHTSTAQPPLYSAVLHPDHPACEPDSPAGLIMGDYTSTFGVPFTSSFGTNYSRPFSTGEYFSCYSLPLPLIHPSVLERPPADFAVALSTCCPFRLGQSFVDHLVDTHLFAILDTIDSPIEFVCRSLVTVPSSSERIPTDVDWMHAYVADPDTALMFKRLSSKSAFSKSDILELTAAYREYIRDDRIALVEGKLVVFQSVQNNQELLMLIVVPLSLRRNVFSAYHASAASGHMGIYKTLHRIRLRFFWPLARKNVTDWVLQCPHCIAANGTVSRNSELIFSWPLCCPFYILHVDLWAPGDITNYRGESYLLTVMCDLCGFVIINVTKQITANELARVFVQEVLLKIGFCGLVVVDDGSTFKGLFLSVCKLLTIATHVAAKGNHKAVSVEHFHRFLNKAVTIATNDRGTLDCWVEAAHTAAYAWNSSPIDGTDIIRSVPAVGRPFRFPYDISLSTIPQPTENQACDVHSFLRHAQPTALFAEQVLRLLTDERRSKHRELANAARNPVAYHPGDLVMARVQVNSNATNGTVAKLSYRKRGPYEIVEATGFGAYWVRRFGHPTSPLLKYPTQSLSALPPALLPCTPVDTPDFRYLNHSHAPLPHPLDKPFRIQMYNNMWFPSSVLTDHPPVFHFRDDPDVLSPPDSSTTIYSASIPAACAIPIVSADLSAPPIPVTLTTSSSLHASIEASDDKLFFVAYRNAGTLRPRWYLVQVDMIQTLLENPAVDCSISGRYYCHFFGKHPDDLSLPDITSRFWPLWHRFSTAADGVLEFGARTLFTPNLIPDSSRYIAWADVLPLLDPSVCIFGPFSFMSPSSNPPGRTSSYRQCLFHSCWSALAAACLDRGITPPTLSSPPTVRSRWLR